MERLVSSSVDAVFQESVGSGLARDVFEGSPDLLKENTLVAQLRSMRDSMVMWLAFLKTSFAKEPPLERLMKARLVRVQLSGDSFGLVMAAFAPGPGHIDDQLQRFALARGWLHIQRQTTMVQAKLWLVQAIKGEVQPGKRTIIPKGCLPRVAGGAFSLRSLCKVLRSHNLHQQRRHLRKQKRIEH